MTMNGDVDTGLDMLWHADKPLLESSSELETVKGSTERDTSSTWASFIHYKTGMLSGSV